MKNDVVEKWMERNDYENYALESDTNGRITIYISDILNHFYNDILCLEESKSKIIELINFFLFDHDLENVKSSIVNIEILTIDDDMIIDITTHLPMLLRGKNGSVVKKLTDYLDGRLSKNIQINIMESKLWH